MDYYEDYYYYILGLNLYSILDFEIGCIIEIIGLSLYFDLVKSSYNIYYLISSK